MPWWYLHMSQVNSLAMTMQDLAGCNMGTNTTGYPPHKTQKWVRIWHIQVIGLGWVIYFLQGTPPQPVLWHVAPPWLSSTIGWCHSTASCHSWWQVVSCVTLVWHISDPFWVTLWKLLTWLPQVLYVFSHTKGTYFPLISWNVITTMIPPVNTPWHESNISGWGPSPAAGL